MPAVIISACLKHKIKKHSVASWSGKSFINNAINVNFTLLADKILFQLLLVVVAEQAQAVTS